MPSFQFLHAADLHIDSPLRGLPADAPADRIRRATRDAVDRLADYAIRHHIPLVVLAGDLFDGDWQDWRTGQFLTETLARLSRAGIRVVAIRGNHDAASVLTRNIAWPDGARLLRHDRPESVSFDDLGVTVHGQSFAARSVTDNLARDYPAPDPGYLNIGLLHTACGNAAHENYAPCTVPQLAAHGYDYWALGHVHQHDVLLRTPWIVFAGNPQGRHANETGAKGAMLVTVRDGAVASAVPVVLDAVRWASVDVDLSGVSDEETAFQHVRRALADAADAADGRMLAARVHLSGSCAVHGALARDLSALHGRLQGEASSLSPDIWIEDARLQTTPALDLPTLVARGDALGRLARRILEDLTSQDPSVQDYLEKLLDRRLAAALGPNHPAVQLADGRPSPDLHARARALVLARLAGEG